jgi:hypothetical protein
MLVSFEGLDGVGKTSIVEAVASALQSQSKALVALPEFSDSPLGDRLVELLSEDKFFQPHTTGTGPLTRTLELAAYADRKVPIDVVIGRELTRRSQVVKQADVVALIALLPQEFPSAMAETNFRHYEPRCAHGSSLSTGMHALVAARLGDAEMALRYLRATAATDLDLDPNSAGGVRIAVRKNGGLAVEPGDIEQLRFVFGKTGVHLTQVEAGTGAGGAAFDGRAVGGQIEDDPTHLLVGG